MKRPTGEIKGRKKGTIKARELLRYEKKRQGKQVRAAAARADLALALAPVLAFFGFILFMAITDKRA